MRLGATGGGGQGAARISLRVGRGEGAEVQNLIRSSPGRRPTPIARLGWSARLRAPPWHAPEGFLLLTTWADEGVDRTIYVRKKRWSRSETFLASSIHQAVNFRTLVLLSVASVFGATLTPPSAYGHCQRVG